MSLDHEEEITVPHRPQKQTKQNISDNCWDPRSKLYHKQNPKSGPKKSLKTTDHYHCRICKYVNITLWIQNLGKYTVRIRWSVCLFIPLHLVTTWCPLLYEQTKLYWVYCDVMPQTWKRIFEQWVILPSKRDIKETRKEKCVTQFVRWKICHWTLHLLLLI